jgi:hypothetical protein
MKLKKLFLFLVCFALQSVSQETDTLPLVPSPETFLLKGYVEGTDSVFNITNSDYLNISLECSQKLKVSIHSIPQTIYIKIDSTYNDTAANLTIKGLSPNTIYYLYNVHGKLFSITTDESGSFSFQQDLRSLGMVWIQPRPSTLYLKTAANQITGWFDDQGTQITDNSVAWNPISRAASINTSINQTIYIQLDNVTLEGNNFSLTGIQRSGNGININTKNVTVRNLTISNFSTGAFITGDSITIESCYFKNISTGIHSNSGNGNVYRNNIFQGLDLGLSIDNASDIVDENQFIGQTAYPYGIMVSSSGKPVDIKTTRFKVLVME